MTRTLIIGTGDMAYALCHLFKNHNYNPAQHCLAVTKPGLNRQTLKGRSAFHDTAVPFVKMQDSIHVSEVIILAIPASALKPFLNKYFHMMKNKIIVDVTNSNTAGEDLQAILGLTDTPWVKAFNDNGAVDALLDKPYSKKPKVTNMCGNNMEAVLTVKTFAEEALGFDVKIVPCERYVELAMNQNSVGDDWVYSTYIIVVLFVLTEIYALVRYNVWKGYDWFHLPLQVTNKAICWTALNAFALTMLPGLMARFFDAIHGDKSKNKPKWILFGLKIRKALGLIALWFLGIHILMSLLMFNRKYYGKFFVDKDASSSKLNAIGETSFFFGIIGAGFYFILGICSLPSVGTGMTSRSWQIVYGPLAWAALAFGTIHVLIMGVKGWTDQESWPGNLPPITMTSTLIPMFVIFLKLVQIATVYLSSSIFRKHDDGPAHNIFFEESMRTLMMGDGTLPTNNNNEPSSSTMSNALTPYVGDGASSASSTEIREISNHRRSSHIPLLEEEDSNNNSNRSAPSSHKSVHKKKSSKRNRSSRTAGTLSTTFRDEVSAELDHDPNWP